MVSLEKLKQLKELKELLDSNIINEKEFIKLKDELLNEVLESNEENDTENVSIKDDFGKTSNSEENNSRNFHWSDITEHVTAEDEINKWKNLKSKMDEPSSETKKTNSDSVVRKSSFNNLPLIIFLAIAGVIGFLVYNEKAKDETDIENSQSSRFTYLTEPVDDLESMSVTGITNEQELYAYLDEVATYWCSEWQNAKQYQNENKRFEEMLKVDRCINAYPLGFTEGIIMLNDLPMELSERARLYFQNKVRELGFDPNWNEENSQAENNLNVKSSELQNNTSTTGENIKIKRIYFSDGMGSFTFDHKQGDIYKVTYRYMDYPALDEHDAIVKSKNGKIISIKSTNKPYDWDILKYENDNLLVFNPESDSYHYYSLKENW